MKLLSSPLAGSLPVERSVTEIVEEATCLSSQASCACIDSSSACRLVASRSSATIWSSVVALSINARTRSRLADTVLMRAVRSTWAVVTSLD